MPVVMPRCGWSPRPCRERTNPCALAALPPIMPSTPRSGPSTPSVFGPMNRAPACFAALVDFQHIVDGHAIRHDHQQFDARINRFERRVFDQRGGDEQHTSMSIAPMASRALRTVLPPQGRLQPRCRLCRGYTRDDLCMVAHQPRGVRPSRPVIPWNEDALVGINQNGHRCPYIRQSGDGQEDTPAPVAEEMIRINYTLDTLQLPFLVCSGEILSTESVSGDKRENAGRRLSRRLCRTSRHTA